jgi:hypothetical protein
MDAKTRRAKAARPGMPRTRPSVGSGGMRVGV